ncbi:hypothetical protein STCU_02610 [Strigomonas culicis]|uniref:Uncharacterized protein n=1 Tax=Strigomonas culicis TaxID=28005 RepID=S9UPM6_9TRYP|nr:hypothetical protein STCU_04081 [Strigomonas culicis]EPY32852.1 hypothetical protein STCU_02610 [Strigomonas culicis]|eukprot:EPY30408.1 hypothetical protein STCU_04081 [Strigomonas culicis]
MGDRHLSELCKGASLEPLLARLRELVGLSAGHDDEEDPYMQGVWGYKDGDGRTAFHWAVAMRNYELATTLMLPPHDAPVWTEDNEGVTPFLSACLVGAPDGFVLDLMDRCVQVHESFRHSAAAHRPPRESARDAGATAEAAAAATAEVPALQALLDGRDNIGTTPLLAAVSRGHEGLVRLLLAKGADLTLPNNRGQSALHRAVSRGNTNLVELLVETSERRCGKARAAHRQWMDLQDYRGDSALFYASMENNEEIGRYLIRHEADRELRNKEGKQFWEV